MASSSEADLRRAPKTSPPASTASLVLFFEWFRDLGFFCSNWSEPSSCLPTKHGNSRTNWTSLGAKSLPLVALAGAAAGVVVSLETHDSLVSFGAKSLLPALVVVSIIKESGPIITGLIVSGRVAAGIGAELVLCRFLAVERDVGPTPDS